uniref:Uncharacterized protein n=1 Tax=Candidatus Methanophagaceae archaeon ANME-1 ERB6 TaxID=2759912 RepID=A0A7G9YZU1_9EURY|nr:hypothetical protein FLCOADKM_00015 [Methanosarcinales archaeon ANME-1 ERB6]
MEAQEFSLKRELQRKAVHATSVLIVIFCYFFCQLTAEFTENAEDVGLGV